eukprot:g2515.t1
MSSKFELHINVRIGVLCLQGAFREHVSQLRRIENVTPVEVRTSTELFSVHGLVIPGGESTTMAQIALRSGLIESLIQFRKDGRPIWGTCAGLILLAERAEGQKQGGQALIGGLDIVVCRNFFGTQIQSFEIELECPNCLKKYGSDPFRGVFIRAPAILESNVEIVCEMKLNGTQKMKLDRDHVIVAVKSQTCLATAFHPELTGDNRWHQLFTEMVIEFIKSSGFQLDGDELISKDIKSSAPLDLPVFGKEHIVMTSQLEEFT